MCWQHVQYEDVNISLVPVIKMYSNLTLNVKLKINGQRTQHSGGILQVISGPRNSGPKINGHCRSLS